MQRSLAVRCYYSGMKYPDKVEKLLTLQTPESLNRRHLAEKFPTAMLAIADPESEAFALAVAEIVSSQEFQGLIDAGKITYAMIKPRLHEGVEGSLEGKSDWEIESVLMREVQPPLEVILSFSFTMSQGMLDHFYEGKPKKTQLNALPIDRKRYGMNHLTRWDEFGALMTLGPSTAMILYEPNGHAVPIWRDQMGDTWDVAKAKREFPNSVRARFAKDPHNNFVHGSDSPESVKRELNLVTHVLAHLGTRL